MYKALENMGLKTGNILEPSCGVGNFIGMLPDSLEDCKLYGVELDSISGRIARQLYQKSTIGVQGYEDTNLHNSFFDVAVGNVPFGDFKVLDKKYDKHKFLIHDYFFAKTLDNVRPGGVIAFITSKGTLDKENPSPIKFVFFEEGEEYQKLKELILSIHKNNKNSHILILERTNKIIDTMYEEPELIDDMETKVKYQGYDDIDIDGMTIHKFKGLTSDEVIIGLDSRFPKPYYGDFWLKEIYKNNWYEEKISFVEERRLFYVALTRTKNNVYLLVNKDADNRSPFINEIYNIMINNKKSI